MKVYYIYHSGFALETDSLMLIIDYYKDSDDSNLESGIVHSQLLNTKKPIYVLSTHAHHDHFNPEILRWKQTNPKIKYIFSRDILDLKLAKKEDANYLCKGEAFEDNNLSIEAFGSTDQGVSFLIHIDNKLIFHAGDLNNWHWKDESSAEESQFAENWYLEELTDIYRQYKVLDLVLFPVDQRLQTDYYLGAEQFISKIHTRYFAPMHFDENYKAANAFADVVKKYKTTFLEIKEKGQTFNIDL